MSSVLLLLWGLRQDIARADIEEEADKTLSFTSTAKAS